MIEYAIILSGIGDTGRRRVLIDRAGLQRLLEEYKSGAVTTNDVVDRLSGMPYEDLGFAKVDHHRAIRQGFPEVVFGEGKTPDQIVALARSLLSKSERLLVTRATPEAYDKLLCEVPDAEYQQDARTIVVNRERGQDLAPGLIVLSGGTSDLPVATEASITAELMGCEVETIVDVGVAGIHRLFDRLSTIQRAKVIVVVAGMEGALPSVVGGLVKVPVIAVPTSVGYGSSFDGLAALLTMLNSCAPGVSVVNIDNGFGAGYMAAMILQNDKA